MSKDKDTEIKSKYDDYSVEELKAALNAIFDSSDEFSDSQVEEMDKIMAVLTKKNPLPQRYTAEESWKIFQETYSEELSRIGIRNTEEVMEQEPKEAGEVDTTVVVPVISAMQPDTESANAEAKHGRSSRKLLRSALFAAAVVALMVIITVSAAAVGIDIWRWIQVRGEGTVRFVTEDALSKDIPAALKQAGVEEPLFPTWIPEGFLLFDQEIRLDNPIHIFTTYVFNDKVLMLSIMFISNESESCMIEIEDSNPEEYLSNGIVHNLITNYDQLVAYWMNHGFWVQISGDISVDELKHIIDSIYEVT